MKRAADFDANALYNDASRIIAESQATISDHLSKPLPPIPLKDVDELYESMEEKFLASVEDGGLKTRFIMYHSPVDFEIPYQAKERWWKHVTEWNKTMDERAGFISAHGTEAQQDQHKRMIEEAHVTFRAEFSRYCNDSHHGVPGDWEGYKRYNIDDATLDFVVRYQKKAE